MTRQLRHDAVIAAPPDAVWDMLLDVAAWHEWNPTLSDPDGPLEPGRRVAMTLHLGPVDMAMRQDVQALEPGRLLTWRSRNRPAGMDVLRRFELHPLPGGGVVLSQSEAPAGWLASLVLPVLRGWIVDGHVALAEALRARVEDGAVEVDSAAIPRDLVHAGRATTPAAATPTMTTPPSTELHVSDRDDRPDWRDRINQHETFDHDSIDSLFHDWDRIGDPDGAPRAPLKFYVPQDTDDVVTAVDECRALGQVLFVRSKGHSSNDLVTPVGGAVLLTEKLRGVLDVDADAMTVTAWAGTPSAEVDEHLAGHGLGLPVIGDHAHITIGGFASVGGITASSFRYGLFADIVEAMEYVDWSGRVHTVARDDDDPEFNRLLLGLGRHGVLTRLTLRVIAIRKHDSYWRNDATRYRDMDEFIADSRRWCADPPDDARFMRGLWVDFPLSDSRRLELGTFSIYRDAEMTPARKAREFAGYGGLHRLGWMAGRLPDRIDELVKTAGMAGVVFAPRYATVKNAEFFTEKTLDATVGDPQRFLVVIAPMDQYEEQFRALWDLLSDYRDRFECFTFLTLYVKSIDSPYLAQGSPDRRRWVEFLFYVGINTDLMTPELLDRVADDLDQHCIDTGAYRYMHTRTGRDPQRLAQVDPNAPYNDGVSIHPTDLEPR